MAHWQRVLDSLEIRTVDADRDEVEYTCQARELTRLVEGHGRYRVVALVELPVLSGIRTIEGTTHLLTVAVKRPLSEGQHP